MSKDKGPKTNTAGMELKRELGLFSAVSLIINTTIGSGIFVSPAMVYKYTGSVALCLIMWVISGLMSLLVFITYLNARSVKIFLKIQNLFTLTKLIICLFVIGGGLYHICSGNTENLQTGFEGSKISPALALAFVYGIFAFMGWNSITAVTEEIKKPEVNILRSILIAQPFVAIFYILMNISYMSALTYDEMTSGEAVAVIFAQKILSWFTSVVPLGVAISIFGTTMAIQFAVTRLCYVAAQSGHMPEVLSYVHIEYLTPYPAVLLQGILGCLCILIGELTSLIQFASVIGWILHALCMVALIILRKTMGDVARPIKVPVILPIFFLIVSLFVCVVTVIADLSMKYVVALALMIICIPVYYFFVYKKHCSQWTQKITYALQLLCVIGPMD